MGPRNHVGPTATATVHVHVLIAIPTGRGTFEGVSVRPVGKYCYTELSTAKRLHSRNTRTESSCPQQYRGLVLFVRRSTFAFTRNQRYFSNLKFKTACL